MVALIVGNYFGRHHRLYNIIWLILSIVFVNWKLIIFHPVVVG